jgi:hypothetical protein
MSDTGTSLDDVFGNQSAAMEPQEPVGPVVAEPAQAEPIDTGEPHAAPPAVAPVEPDHVPRTALMDERRKRQEYERRTQELEQYIRAQQAQTQAPQPQQSVKAEQGIRPENFPTYEAFLEAVAEAKAEAKANEVFERNMQRANQAQQQAAVQQQTAGDLSDMIKAGADKYPDFMHVVGNPNVPISETMMNTMMALDGGHEVAYSLAMNPGEAARIARMPPSSQAREIGKLAKSFAAPVAPVVTAPPVVPQLPKTLTQTRSASGQFTNKPWTGPTPLDEVVRKR